MKSWLLRPKPHNIPRMKEFLNQNIIAIGWPEITSFSGKSKKDIQNDLSHHPLNYQPQELGIATSTVNSFVNEMRIGDLVVLPHGNDIFFAKITSDYFYAPANVAEGFPHQRQVEWIKGPVRRNEIFEGLRKSLRAPRALADLSHHTDKISDFIESGIAIPTTTTTTDETFQENLVEFQYPIRLDTIATIRIPKDITQAEASRLSDFVKTLYF